jgi:hypothetical protein
MTNKAPMTNAQRRARLVIGAWSFVGHWDLAIGASSPPIPGVCK